MFEERESDFWKREELEEAAYRWMNKEPKVLREVREEFEKQLYNKAVSYHKSFNTLIR